MIEDINKDVNPLPKLKHAFEVLDRRQVHKERLAISLVLSLEPNEYVKDCFQKRIGIKKGLQKGDTLEYYKCDKQEIIIDIGKRKNNKCKRIR